MIIVGAVLIVFAVGFVVFVVVADQVVERETIVRGNEVDAGRGPPAIALIQVAAPVSR